MLVLGIESSCDETGVALSDTVVGLRSHALHTQVEMHAEYGGVVPELASRDHIRRIVPLTRRVLDEVGVSLAAVDAIAYTQGPGLAGALLVGASFAQGLAVGLGISAIGVHHLEGHLLSPLLADPRPEFPFVALLVSGGHTQLMQVDGVGRYTLLGETLDDAAGEAFDKTGQLLGLPYPGGPEISRLAQQGDAFRYPLPRPMLMSSDLDFSFSGLKTAVLNLVHKHPDARREDVAAAFQAAAVDVLASKALKALKQTGFCRLVIAGGVSANTLLRSRLNAEVARVGATVYYPPLALCTDNGAMIAYAGAQRLVADALPSDGVFTVRPRWPLSQLQAA